MAKGYQYPGTMSFERHVFERERLGIDFHLSKKEQETMKGWDIQHFEEDMGHSIVWRVTTLMAHGDRTVTATEDVPITWWNHLKLDVNRWALAHILYPHFFFTNIARAIVRLSITPKFRRIEKSILIKHFCPHISTGDNRPHVEFMLHNPPDMRALKENVDRFPYGGTAGGYE